MGSRDRAAHLIAALGMQPHPEGGHYDEAWHFHEGAPLDLLTAGLDFERLDRHVLGPVEASDDVAAAERARHRQPAAAAFI